MGSIWYAPEGLYFNTAARFVTVCTHEHVCFVWGVVSVLMGILGSLLSLLSGNLDPMDGLSYRCVMVGKRLLNLNVLRVVDRFSGWKWRFMARMILHS
jgi:hypothetical protein